MMKADDTRPIDEHIAAELSRIAARVFGQPAACEFLHVGDPRFASKDVPEASLVHAVTAVQRAIAVDEHRPGDFRVGEVRSRRRRSLERHDRDLYSQFPERLLVLLQLQQVPAAGESA